MVMGKGTYGSQVGRPRKNSSMKNTKNMPRKPRKNSGKKSRK